MRCGETGRWMRTNACCRSASMSFTKRTRSRIVDSKKKLRDAWRNSAPRSTTTRRTWPPSSRSSRPGRRASARKKPPSRRRSVTSSRRTQSAPRTPPRPKETLMLARLSRLFRAWMGFFISMGEDPEVMLQDAIEEMRMTMPKLNSVLVATRATVIRLEEERDALKRQDRNLTAAIQAALRDGSVAARSVAEEDAIQLQQLRTDLSSTQEQLTAAERAHESAKISVDTLK